MIRMNGLRLPMHEAVRPLHRLISNRAVVSHNFRTISVPDLQFLAERAACVPTKRLFSGSTGALAATSDARPSILTGASESDILDDTVTTDSASTRRRRKDNESTGTKQATDQRESSPSSNEAAAGTEPAPYDPTMEIPTLDEAELSFLSHRWERRRLRWLVTGSPEPPASSGHPNSSKAVADSAALSARLAAMRRLRKRKPVKVNVKSILQFITDPSRPTIAFTKPLPLANMVGIMNTAWEAEAGEGGAPGAPKTPA